jgi:hypothetical protein
MTWEDAESELESGALITRPGLRGEFLYMHDDQICISRPDATEDTPYNPTRTDKKSTTWYDWEEGA